MRRMHVPSLMAAAGACQSLLLQSNRLEGTLPPSWGSGGGFTWLRELGLNDNNFRGDQRLAIACLPVAHRSGTLHGLLFRQCHPSRSSPLPCLYMPPPCRLAALCLELWKPQGQHLWGTQHGRGDVFWQLVYR